MDIQQRLWLAALEGHIDEAQELIDKGANVNAATDLFKATALHRASLMGKSSAVNVLLKVGANVNQQDGDGLTALHMAANIGNRLIVLNLLRAGALIDAENRDGRTPLHLAAINGDFKTSQLLISEKATIDATDRDGNTPLDLAKKKIEEKRDEGLTDTAEPWYRTVGLLESFHKKPSQDKEEPSLLQNFGEEVESRFHKYLQQGSEEYYEINLMFIGQAGVGKTTLTKGLLGELDPYVSPPSTNGIDLHQHRCKYNRLTRHIYPVSIENTDHVLNQRIGNLIQMSLKSIPVQCSGSVPSSESLENTSVCVQEMTTLSLEQEKQTLEDNKKNQMEACFMDNTEASKGTLRNNVESSEPRSLNAKSLKQQNPEISTLDEVTEICTVVYERESQVKTGGTYFDYTETRSTASVQVKSLVNRAELSLSEETLEKLVPITIWDFGGQEVFYTTHQTFLSSCCIYIIVFNLFEFWQELNPNSRSENTLKTISFWINSVITYAKHTVAGYPKIVLVGTHADCFQAKERGNSLWKIFQKLEAYFRRSVQRQHLVINPRYFIDARDSEGVPFDLLRQCVMEIAESLPDWGLPIPHKWVVLENLIADLRSSGCKVVSVDKLQSMLSNEFHFQKQEIEDFLIFQHSYSKILYFKESHLHDNVILDPSWVIDALSSFITDERTRTYSPNSNPKEWENLRVRGKLSRNLIKDVWGRSDFGPFQEYLLNVLCRLDLITRSKSGNFFYVPGMVTEKCPHQIVDDILSSAEVGLVSFKISFKNNFLPPAIYNRIVAAFISMFENSAHLAMQLFENCAIFELSQNRWTTLKKDGHEILVFTYMSDRRGRAGDLKAFRSVYSITLDCLRDLLKIYSAFQNPSVRQNDLPFQVFCQGCRKPNCYVSEKAFHDLDNYRCPYHGDYLCSVEVLEELFGAKENQEDRRDTVSTNSNRHYLPVISPDNLENVECFLDYIASKLKGTECVFLAAALGYGVSLVERQRHEYSSQQELVFGILYNWQKRHPLSENVNVLFQALGDIEQKELVEEMKNFSLQKFVECACSIDIPKPDEAISEEDLVIISKKVKQFKRLLRFVRFSQKCIDDLELELRDSSQDYIALMMLSKWKETGPNPNRRTLCAALLYIECRDLIDKLIQRWQQKMFCSGT